MTLLTFVAILAGCALITEDEYAARSQICECEEYTWYQDQDNDGYGCSYAVIVSCEDPSSSIAYVPRSGDCDDDNANTFPGAVEQCDGEDNDCDDEIDEDTEQGTWYADADGDGYGDEDSPVVACQIPEGYVSETGDCDDHDASVHPGAEEICGDLQDNDCDGGATACEIHGILSVNDADYTIVGYQEDQSFGKHVDMADLDDDGVLDFLFGTPSGTTPESSVHLFMGPVTESESAASADYVLSPPPGWEEAQYGALVAGWGQEHGGTGDFIVGCPSSSVTYASEGSLFYYEGPLQADIDGSDYAALVVGESENQLVGWFADLNDIDQDGHADLVVGSPFTSAAYENTGSVHFYLGPLDDTLLLSEADGIIEGETENAAVGLTVAIVGDVNGDGMPDTMAGGLGENVAYLSMGALEGTVSASQADHIFTIENSDAMVLVLVSGAGDTDHDGYADYMISTLFWDDFLHPMSGSVHLFLGPPSGDPSMADANFTIEDEEAFTVLGISTSTAGDVNADGFDDFLVGAPYAHEAMGTAGAAFLFYGPQTGTGLVTDADATWYGDVGGDMTGIALAGAGDSDQDGFADFIIGASSVDSPYTSAGAAYIILGAGL